MRILHITPDYYPAMGGGELYIKEISERLARRGHDVTVLTMNSRGISQGNGAGSKVETLINQVKVHQFARAYRLHDRLTNMHGAHRLLRAMSFERRQMVLTSPYSLSAFKFTLRSHADVVAVINWYHGSLAHQTCLARRIRHFALVGIPLFHTERDWSDSPLYGGMLSRCDAVLAGTDHEKRFIEERSTRNNAHLVGVGVDPSVFAHRDGSQIRSRYGIGDAPLVGYVGRMSASKGVVTLIKAMKVVWRADPRVRLLLAGSGLPSGATCDDDVRAAFGALSAVERSRVICISRFSDEEKASIFDALDLFVMVSVAESFGITYLEAWMCLKPVIGSRAGSTECVIRDGADGTLVAPEDPEALASSIVGLLSDDERRRQMGAAGHAKTLARFTWDQIADKVECIYTNAHAGRGRAGCTPAGVDR